MSFGIGNNSSAFLGWISQLLRESVGKWKICINQQSDLRKNSCCYCSFILDMSTFKDLGLNWFSHMWTESPRNEALHSPAAEICYPAVATPRKMSNSWKPGNDGENIIEVPSWFHTFLSFWLYTIYLLKLVLLTLFRTTHDSMTDFNWFNNVNNFFPWIQYIMGGFRNSSTPFKNQ